MGQFFFYGLGTFILFFILLYKRKSQVGKTWKGRLSAKVELSHAPLICRHCQNDTFFKREALIQTTFVQLLTWSSLNQSGSVYECTRCGFLHWFSRPKETSVEYVRLKQEEVQSE